MNSAFTNVVRASGSVEFLPEGELEEIFADLPGGKPSQGVASYVYNDLDPSVADVAVFVTHNVENLLTSGSRGYSATATCPRAIVEGTKVVICLSAAAARSEGERHAITFTAAGEAEEGAVIPPYPSELG